MKLVYAREMGALDKKSAEEFYLPTAVLMENAGRAVAEAAAELLDGDVYAKSVVIFAGKGNNGGDGLVAARWLSAEGARVKIFLATPVADFTGAAAMQLKICAKSGLAINLLNDETDWHVAEIAAAHADLLIDALLGTGFKGELTGSYKRACELMNGARADVLAVDVPSGAEADTGLADESAVQAAATVTMQLPKVGLYLYPAAEFAGKLIVVPIGMPEALTEQAEGSKYLLDSEIVRDFLPIRSGNCHKGEAGRVVVTAGSPGYTGAAALCANAAVKAGAGLVSLYTPLCSREVLAVKLTEVMVKGLIERMPGVLGGGAANEVLDAANKADVLAIGPGLGTSEATGEVIMNILQGYEGTAVIDADALTALSRSVDVLPQLKCTKILTPHPGEMARLCGLTAGEVDVRRVELAEKYAQEWNCVLVLKGAPTVIGCPDGTVYVNTTGTSAMATGGCGDVLTGIIAGLCAQGVEAEAAAVCGVYLHGLAGELAAKGCIGLAAGELAALLPEARRMVENGEI